MKRRSFIPAIPAAITATITATMLVTLAHWALGLSFTEAAYASSEAKEAEEAEAWQTLDRDHIELFSLDSPDSAFNLEPATPETSDALGNDFTSIAVREFPDLGIIVPESGPGATDFYRSMKFLTGHARQHVRDVLAASRKQYARSETRIETVKRILADAGLPTQLAWMVAQESAFNDRARSHKGAQGAWQFMRATAQRLGLVNRANLVQATDAAAEYLSEMYEGKLSAVNYRWKAWRGRQPVIWKKDWAMAISGYNSGEFNITRAIYKHLLKTDKHNSRPEQPSIWDIRPWLPGQTQHYLTVVLAWIRVAENPARFGFAER